MKIETRKPTAGSRLRSIAVIIRFGAAFLLVLVAAFPAGAQPVPGTSVRLDPPSGYVKADRFAGFLNKNTGSAIMVTEIPAPFAEMSKGFTEENLRKKGMTLLQRSPMTLGGDRALLLLVGQSANGAAYRKWVLAVDRGEQSAVIMALYPEASADRQEALLKAAVLSVTFGEPSNPMEALLFTVTPLPPFKVGKVIGRSLVLTPDGIFPARDEKTPFMVIGMSGRIDFAISDKKGFAEKRILQTNQVGNIRGVESIPVTLAGLSGFRTIADAVGTGSATPMNVFQVMLFDTHGYALIQGLTPSETKDRYFPVFEKIAGSFALKK